MNDGDRRINLKIHHPGGHFIYLRQKRNQDNFLLIIFAVDKQIDKAGLFVRRCRQQFRDRDGFLRLPGDVPAGVISQVRK